jgi:hypothetical protein
MRLDEPQQYSACVCCFAFEFLWDAVLKRIPTMAKAFGHIATSRPPTLRTPRASFRARALAQPRRLRQRHHCQSEVDTESVGLAAGCSGGPGRLCLQTLPLTRVLVPHLCASCMHQVANRSRAHRSSAGYCAQTGRRAPARWHASAGCTPDGFACCS